VRLRIPRLFWSLHARTWDDTLENPVHQARIAAVADFVQAGDRVVDIGCGTGNYAIAAAHEGASVVGVDAAAGMLARARAKAPGIEFIDHDVTRRLPFPDESFDVAFCLLVLQLISDRPALLAEVRRVVRPGGALIVSDAAGSRRGSYIPSGPIPLSHRAFFWFKRAATWRFSMPDTQELVATMSSAGFGDIDQREGLLIGR
jgi:ubiquinone/menaquinone biosynthesis C-methylase UbiE